MLDFNRSCIFSRLVLFDPLLPGMILLILEFCFLDEKPVVIIRANSLVFLHQFYQEKCHVMGEKISGISSYCLPLGIAITHGPCVTLRGLVTSYHYMNWGVSWCWRPSNMNYHVRAACAQINTAGEKLYVWIEGMCPPIWWDAVFPISQDSHFWWDETGHAWPDVTNSQTMSEPSIWNDGFQLDSTLLFIPDPLQCLSFYPRRFADVWIILTFCIILSYIKFLMWADALWKHTCVFSITQAWHWSITSVFLFVNSPNRNTSTAKQ